MTRPPTARRPWWPGWLAGPATLLGATLLGATLLGATGAAAAEPPLRMVTIDVAPWASTDPASGRAVGVFPDIVAEIGRRTGHELAVSLLPFARIPHELQAGHADCTILVWNDAWAEFMVRGETVSTHVIGVIARKGIALRDYDDLHGKDVSVLRGLSLGKRFDEDPAIRRQSDTDYLAGVRQMARGRIDAVAGALPTIRYQARQAGLADSLGDAIVLEELVLPFQCGRRAARPDAMAAIDAAIRDMRRDGTVSRILRAYDYE